jgi:1-acyl-sn-glycerol-3-phosphate acyltransferase
LIYQKTVARFLLKNSGWKPPSDELIEIMNKNKKLVIVYPHTSHYDGLLMILYKKAYPDFGRHIKFLIRPDLTEIPLLGKFLISNGAIPSTFIQIKNGGRTKEIIDYLNTKDEFKFLISPKGTIRKSEWKTGYYYITKGTNANILALGLNYQTGEIVYNKPYPLTGGEENFPSEEKLRVILQDQLRDIPQRTPWNVEY